MKLLDYTGKLNEHNEYLEMLKKLEEKSKYIEIVVIDERESNDLIDKFKNDIISVKKVSKWWGTETTAINNLYRIKVTKELFEYLRGVETFCKWYFPNATCDEHKQINTDFGIDDIAFYDDNKVPLLCTTTHECYIMIREDLG